MPPTESVVATSLMLICHYWSPYLSEKETVLEAQLTSLGLWKIKYRRISTIQIMTLIRTCSSTLSYYVGEYGELGKPNSRAGTHWIRVAVAWKRGIR
jgi:hypothetical protein